MNSHQRRKKYRFERRELGKEIEVLYNLVLTFIDRDGFYRMPDFIDDDFGVSPEITESSLTLQPYMYNYMETVVQKLREQGYIYKNRKIYKENLNKKRIIRIKNDNK